MRPGMCKWSRTGLYIQGPKYKETGQILSCKESSSAPSWELLQVAYIAWAVALLFAMNIGASGAAASMGIAYGSGAVSKRVALFLCAAGILLGAVSGGGEVVKTLGSDIVPEHMISVPVAIIILAAATLSLFISNMAAVPLSTSEVTVGAIVGVGIAYKVLFVKSILTIVFYWIAVPIIAFLLAFCVGRLVTAAKKFAVNKSWKRILPFFVIATGLTEAVSAGMNNVANAVGPIVAAGLMSVREGIWIGGLFVACGALLLGSRVLETNGKKITEIRLLEGSAVSGLGGTLVIIASHLGLPVPQTQITTCSILGIGMSKKGLRIFEKKITVRLLKIWLISPCFSLVISYNLVKIFIDFDFYSIILVGSVFIATIGLASFRMPVTRAVLSKKSTKVKLKKQYNAER